MVRTRLRSPAGQVAAEYLGALLLVAVVIAALIGSQLHTHVAVEVQRAICKIAGSEECGEPGVPKAGAANDEPGEPDRSVYDDECKNDLPGRLLRGEGDDPAGDPEADAVYDNLGQVFEYYSDTFGRDSYDDSGAELIASINFCEQPGVPTRNAYYLLVQSVGRKAAEQIVYRALTEKLDAHSGFEDFRTASLEVARELWGQDSPEYQGTNESFAAVGLDGTWQAPAVEGC